MPDMSGLIVLVWLSCAAIAMIAVGALVALASIFLEISFGLGFLIVVVAGCVGFAASAVAIK